MAKEYYLQDGQVIKQNRQDRTFGLFSLNKLFKKLAKAYNMAFIDDCCTPDLTNLPVRFNQTLNRLERYQPATDTWVATT